MRRTFDRRERRYLLPDIGTLLPVLAKRAEPASYHVETLYVDRDPPVWSRARKVRLRRYGDEAEYWIEFKRRDGIGRVRKRREPCRVVARVTYQRRAFEWRGTRVTIDKDVSSGQRRMNGFVVEVKGHLPAWLAKVLPEEAKFSKSRWALSELVA